MKFTLLFIIVGIILCSLVNATPYEDCSTYGTCKPESISTYSNITNINNTYINQTVNATVNTTQFDSNNPIHIKESWLTNFIENIVESYNYLTETQADSLYCKLTGCTMNGNINLNNYNITNATFLNNKNVSQIVTGNMSSETITTTIPITCTGGTETTDGDYTIRTFTSNGTLNCNGNIIAEVLVVAGGGAGGNGGGGGAGGLIHENNFSVPAGTYLVTVGDGGNPTSNPNAGLNGENSVFSSLTAIGGGGGGGGTTYNKDGKDGGSGGGGGYNNGGESYDGGSGISGQGYNGGRTIAQACSPAGGGGGAGAVGGDGTNNVGGNGGIGKNYSINGTNIYYAGGGGGGSWCVGLGSGGLGGGGDGALGSAENIGESGTDGLGGGGGGGYTGGTGGSGIVIIRYLTNQSYNTTTLGAKGLMPYVSATNFISTDYAMQWLDNTLINIWNPTSTLGNLTHKWNIFAWNIDAVNITASNICYSNGTNCNITNSSYVPYTGATSNVNLNGKNLSNVTLVNTTAALVQNSVSIGSIISTTSDLSIVKTTVKQDWTSAYLQTLVNASNSSIKYGNFIGFQGNSVGRYGSGNITSLIGVQGFTAYSLGPVSYSGYIDEAIGVKSSLTNLAGPVKNVTNGYLLKGDWSPTVNTKTINGYGLYIPTVTAINKSYAIYTNLGKNRFGDDILIEADSKKLIFGAGSDASIYYDAVDLIINPKEVGTGQVKVLGNLNVTGYNVTATDFYSGTSKGLTQSFNMTNASLVSCQMNFTGGILTASDC